MSLIDDLVCLKQKTIRDFLVSGGKKRNGQHIEFSFIENDPRKLCHPLRTILHPDIKMMSSLAHSMNEICALRLKESDVIIKQPTSQYDMSNTKGINSVAFDCEGLYFSLSGPGGIVRVYDFEESAVAIELRRGHDLQSVANIQTRKGISHVCWSTDTPDELAVCFSFFPQIYIYNLNQNDYTSPARTLEVGRGGSEGGHNIAINWSKKQQASYHLRQSTGKSSFQGSATKPVAPPSTLLAGSVKGYVRCWQSQKSPKQCMWSIIADPNQSALTASPVVGLAMLSDGSSLLTATESGVLVVWDVVRLQVAALGSSASPKCLYRICLYEQGLLNFPRVELVALSLRPPRLPIASLDGQEGEELLLTMGNGTLCLYDLLTDRPQHSTASSFSLGGGDRIFTSGPLSYYPMETKALMACAVFPCWPGTSSCIISHGNSMRVLNMDTSHREAALLRSRHFGQSSIGRHETHTASGELRSTNLRQTDELSHTLPGCVITAENGCFQVVTSHDLQRHLCSEGAAQSSSSRSCRLYLDWSMSGLDGQVGGCAHTVESASTYAVMLREAYCGPSVRKGQPVVYLRTALTPRGVSTIRAPGDGEVWPVLKECQLSFNCTSLVAHPTRPYVVAAGEDGSVRILLPHSTSHVDTQQEVEISLSSSATRSIDLPDERVTLARGNHFNVWRRSAVSGQLVSISREEEEAPKMVDSHAMSAELTEQLAALEEEGIVQEEEEEEEEEEGKSSSRKDDDWLQDVFRDIGGDTRRRKDEEEEEEKREEEEIGETPEWSDHSAAEDRSTVQHNPSPRNNDPDLWTSHIDNPIETDEETTYSPARQDDDSFGALAPLCIEDLMGSNGGGDKENIRREGEGSMSAANGAQPSVPTTYSMFNKAPSSSSSVATSKNKRPFSSTVPHFTSTTSRTAGKGQPLQEAQALLARKHGVNSLSSRVGVSKAPAPVDVLATTCPAMFSAKPTTASHSSNSSHSGGKVDFKSVMGEASSIFSGARAGGAGLKNVRNSSMTALGSTLSSKPVFASGAVKSSNTGGDKIVIAQKRKVNSWCRDERSITAIRGNRREVGDMHYNIFPVESNLAAQFSHEMGVDALKTTHQFVLPGGVSNPDESIWQAGRRTFYEQTGFDINVYTKPSLGKIRAKRFDDVSTVHDSNLEPVTAVDSFYCIYINISALPMDHIGRTVGVFEPGNLIHDNFNVGTRSKMAFRHAINNNMVTSEAPAVDNDELEFVMYASAEEVLGTRPGGLSPTHQALLSPNTSSSSSMFPPIKSLNSPRLPPPSPRSLTGLQSSSNEPAPLLKQSLKLSPSHAAAPTMSISPWLVTILEQRERICGGGAGADQSEEEGLASMAAILRVRTMDDGAFLSRNNREGVTIVSSSGHHSAHLPGTKMSSPSNASSKSHLLKINQRSQMSHQQEQLLKYREFRENTTGFSTLPDVSSGRTLHTPVEYTDATVGHKSVAVLSVHGNSGRIADNLLDPLANQKCPPQFR